MEPELYTATHSLSDELCDEIVHKFETTFAEAQYPGITRKGHDKNVKDTMDINLTLQDSPEWREIEVALRTELQNQMETYLGKIADTYRPISGKPTATFEPIDQLCAPRLTFQIQRYRKGEGKYVYHTDGSDREDGNRRMVTYLWYLNDVTDGGETELWAGAAKIVPEKGKLLLFPADWTYPHRGNVPISSDKYIVTGWIYTTRNGCVS